MFIHIYTHTHTRVYRYSSQSMSVTHRYTHQATVRITNQEDLAHIWQTPSQGACRTLDLVFRDQHHLERKVHKDQTSPNTSSTGWSTCFVTPPVLIIMMARTLPSRPSKRRLFKHRTAFLSKETLHAPCLGSDPSGLKPSCLTPAARLCWTWLLE